MIDEIKEYFGTYKCTGLQINSPEDDMVNMPVKKMRFCEAVQYSFNLPLLINRQNIGCTGAARNLGFEKRPDDELALHISENTGIPMDFVREMLRYTPSMKTPPNNICMGITGRMEERYNPDFYIVYTNPGSVMGLIYRLAQKFQSRPFISSYTLLSICGNVFVRGVQSGALCVSFGCPESRKYGGLEKNDAIVGFPANIGQDLFQS